MAILTDGPSLEAADKWSAAYLAQLEAAHAHQVLINVALGLVALVLVIGAAVLAPRLWRRRPPLPFGLRRDKSA